MKNVFLDMDGVLAKFEKRGWQKVWLNKGYFLELEPYAGIDNLNGLIASGTYNFYILSNSPTEQADNEKIQWIKKYLPAMKVQNIITNRGGKNAISKAEIARRILGRELTENDILIDDYSINLNEWQEMGGYGIKRKNGRNCKNGIYSPKYNKLHRLSSLDKLLKVA